MEKMTLNNFRKTTIKTFPDFLKVTIFLRISKLEITDRKIWENNNDFDYKVQEINLYNPLSYLILAILIPIGLILNGFNKETFRDINELFKNK